MHKTMEIKNWEIKYFIKILFLFRLFFEDTIKFIYSSRQDIWNKVKKSRTKGQEQKNLKIASA